MILGFSTQINGKPTYFVERIWETILQKGIQINLNEFIDIGKQALPKNYKVGTQTPKLHTIREDKNDRWKAGNKIDFFINCRQPNMFRFAPVLPVVSVQEIFMTQRGSLLEISIAKVDSYIGGDDFQLNATQLEELALNDGFDNYDDFSNYFIEAIEKNGKVTGNYWFKGKIIHWADLRY